MTIRTCLAEDFDADMAFYIYEYYQIRVIATFILNSLVEKQEENSNTENPYDLLEWNNMHDDYIRSGRNKKISLLDKLAKSQYHGKSDTFEETIPMTSSMALVIAYGSFEKIMFELIRFVLELYEIDEEELAKVNTLKKAIIRFKKYYSESVFPSDKVSQNADNIELIRNSIVHHMSKIPPMPIVPFMTERIIKRIKQFISQKDEADIKLSEDNSIVIFPAFVKMSLADLEDKLSFTADRLADYCKDNPPPGIILDY